MEYKDMNAIGIVRLMLTDGVITEEQAAKYFPELAESEDERIRKIMIEHFKNKPEQYTFGGLTNAEVVAWLEKHGEMHLENYDKAEKEKADFVGDGFIECHADFLDFKEGNTYWLEYIGDDKYNVRSDNLLGKTYHITPCQLYTIFKKQTWLEKQGEQKSAEWSEEDEKLFKLSLENLTELKDRFGEEYGKVGDCIVWLESIKDRVQHQTSWKPSKEQIMALRWVLNHILYNSHKEEINGLLEQLIKL